MGSSRAHATRAALVLAALLSGRRTAASRVAVAGAVILAAVLPAATMFRHLLDPWVSAYAAAATVALLPLLAVAACRPAQHPIAGRALGSSGLALAVTCVAFLAVLVGRGTSLGALWDARVVRPLQFPDLFRSCHVAPDGWAWACVASGALATTWLVAPPARTAVAAAGKLILVATAWQARTNPVGLLFHAGPFLWAAMAPPWRTARDHRPLPRFVLCFLAATHMLVAYPVFGSQQDWATFLLLLAAIVALADLLRLSARAAQAALPFFAQERARRACSAVVCGVALVVMYLPFVGDSVVGSARAVHERLLPLGLPGAERVRLPEKDVSLCNWAVANLLAHGSTFFSRPGLNSFYAWTGQRPPTQRNTTNWMGLLDDREQEQVVADLRAAERLCILDDAPLLASWFPDDARRSSPLDRFIDGEFSAVLAAGGMRVLVRNERAGAEFRNYLVYGPRSFDGPDDVLPLPPNLLQPEAVSIAGWFRTAAGGVLLGCQSGAIRDARPGVAHALLRIDPDGRLRAGFGSDPRRGLASPTPVNDARWHHVVFGSEPGRAVLFVDGAPVARGPVPVPRAGRGHAQLGGGWAAPLADPVAAPAPGWFHGDLGDVSVAFRVLTEEEAAVLNAAGRWWEPLTAR